MIWAKTDAGRREINDRALVKERARRNLLLVIDGVQSEEALIAALAGIGADDFRALEAQGLIAPVSGSVRASARSVPPIGRGEAQPSSGAVSSSLLAVGSSTSGFGVRAAALSEPAGGTEAPGPAGRDPAIFAATLTRLISNELGLRGFVLSLAIEKATTPSDLEAIAQRTLDQIRERRGDAACASARQTLYGA